MNRSLRGLAVALLATALLLPPGPDVPMSAAAFLLGGDGPLVRDLLVLSVWAQVGAIGALVTGHPSAVWLAVLATVLRRAADPTFLPMPLDPAGLPGSLPLSIGAALAMAPAGSMRRVGLALLVWASVPATLTEPTFRWVVGPLVTALALFGGTRRSLGWLAIACATAATMPLSPGPWVVTLGAMAQLAGVAVALVSVPPSVAAGRTLERSALGAIALAWVAVRLHGFEVNASDDGLYLAAAKSWADGTWPWRDFAFTHPPLHLAPLALLVRLFGPAPILPELLATGAALVTAFLLAGAVRLRHGAIAGLAAFVAFLFASAELEGTNEFTGFELAALAVAGSLRQALLGRPFHAGLLAGLAGAAALPALALVPVVLWPLRTAPRALAGIAVASALAHGPFLALAPTRYVADVVSFHLAKSGGGGVALPSLLLPDALVWVGALVGAAWALRQRTSVVIVGALAALSLPVVVWPEAYPHYLVPALVPAAMLVGIAFREAVDFARDDRRAVLAVLVVAVVSPLLSLAVPRWPGPEARWWPAPVLPRATAFVRTFWRPDPALLRPMDPVARYLFVKKRRFGTLDAIAAHVQETTGPDETLSGASALAPLVALRSERRLAADVIDTNAKRFDTGHLDAATFWRSVCRDRLAIVVAVQDSAFAPAVLAATPWFTAQFRLERRFVDPGLRRGRGLPIELWRRIGEACGPDVNAR